MSDDHDWEMEADDQQCRDIFGENDGANDSRPASCSPAEHTTQNACQRAHNHLTYGLGVAAHMLANGADPNLIAEGLLALCDRAEEIREGNVKHEARLTGSAHSMQDKC